MSDSAPSTEPLLTGDGSYSLYSQTYGEPYHSRHGAISESRHVFIRMGLEAFLVNSPEQVRILEMGLGTGLNAWLTALYPLEIPVTYTALEAYPLGASQWQALNYAELAEDPNQVFENIHQAAWYTRVPLTDQFTLEKVHATLEDFQSPQAFDVVYFDAFAPNSQPELWTEAVFEKMYGLMAPGGLLVTYCAKGAVRRAMQAAGFEVERLPGPPGKREMLRARR
ncbi:MAG: tRNA (5-methylaminomethyl-2-thiouridine)(34)-methyltransferase MnmD [Bacteroidota bacterium]